MVAPLVAGALISGAGSLISGFFGGRSARQQAKDDAKRQKLSDLFQGYRDDMARKRELEDRLYQEKAVNQYGKFYGGDREFAQRVFTDPNSVNPVNPYETKPKKPVLARG